MDREDDIHRLAVFTNFAERPAPITGWQRADLVIHRQAFL